MKSREKRFDNLKILGGIGERRQKFIREKLNVRTYQDLANLSVDQIAHVFQVEGKPISRKIITQWIERAAKKAQEAESSKHSNGWEWLNKIFITEFRVSKIDGVIKKRQSRVYHTRVNIKGDWLDNGEKIPIVITGNELYPWMLKQLGEPLHLWTNLDEDAFKRMIVDDTDVEDSLYKGSEKEKEKMTTVSHAKDAEELLNGDEHLSIDRLEKIEIREIRIFRPLGNNTPIRIDKNTEPFLGKIHSEQPFMIEVVFDLPELAEVTLKPTATYKVDFYVKERVKGKSFSIGVTEPGQLTAGKVTYSAQLPDVTLQIGDYDLGVIVYIQSQPPNASYLEVSHFRVL